MMVDEFIEELDNCFARGIVKIPVVGIGSYWDLVRAMWEAVDINPKLSEAQKKHIKDNIAVYIADAVWTKSKYFKNYVIGETIRPILSLTLGRDNADRIVKEIEMTKTAHLKLILSKTTTPINERTLISAIVTETKLDVETVKTKINALREAKLLNFDGTNYVLSELGDAIRRKIEEMEWTGETK